MAEYIDKSAEVHEGYLTDWYINSVAEYADEKLNEPRWTEAHIEELTNDFIIIPKDTPAADVAPVVHGRWYYNENGMDWGLGAWQCSVCKTNNRNLPGDPKIYPLAWQGSRYCPNCGAKMDEEEHNNNV